MNFNISEPVQGTDLYMGIQKVGAIGAVARTRIEYGNSLTLTGP